MKGTLVKVICPKTNRGSFEVMALKTFEASLAKESEMKFLISVFLNMKILYDGSLYICECACEGFILIYLSTE